MTSRFIRLTTAGGLIEIIDSTLIASISEERPAGVIVHWKDSMKSGTRYVEPIQKVLRMLDL